MLPNLNLYLQYLLKEVDFEDEMNLPDDLYNYDGSKLNKKFTLIKFFYFMDHGIT